MKPSPSECQKCPKTNLLHFMKTKEGEVLCLDCYEPKVCADCKGMDLLEFFTSQRDGREICSDCFGRLNKKGRAKEKGFLINGKPMIDRKAEEADKLKKRRIENSITYAQGLKRDKLAHTKKDAGKIMRAAGCRYVSQALSSLDRNFDYKASVELFPETRVFPF